MNFEVQREGYSKILKENDTLSLVKFCINQSPSGVSDRLKSTFQVTGHDGSPFKETEFVDVTILKGGLRVSSRRNGITPTESGKLIEEKTITISNDLITSDGIHLLEISDSLLTRLKVMPIQENGNYKLNGKNASSQKPPRRP